MRSKSEHHIWWQLRCLQLTTAQTFRQCAYGLRGDGADFSRKFWGPEPDFYIDLRRSQTNRNCQSQTFWQPPTSGLFWKAPNFFFCTSKSYRMIPRRVWGLPSRDTAHVTVEPFSEWHAICFGGVDRSLFYFCAAGMVHMGICSLLFQICSWHLKQNFLLQKSFLIFSRLLRSFPGHRFGCTTTSPGSQDMPCKCSTSWDPVIKGMYCSGWSWMVQSFGGHNLPCDRTCLVFSLPTIPANSSIDFAKACASQSTS